jgi:hypothetical protein
MITIAFDSEILQQVFNGARHLFGWTVDDRCAVEISIAFHETLEVVQDVLRL